MKRRILKRYTFSLPVDAVEIVADTEVAARKLLAREVGYDTSLDYELDEITEVSER